jgi:hypothetical protein
LSKSEEQDTTYIFDVRARVDSDDVAMLDSEIVANHSVDAGVAILKIVIGEHDQDSVFALLALDEHGVASEEL